MKLAEVSVRRPVFAVMMSIALMVLGWSSYGGLGLDLMPRTDSPTVNVRAGLQGASAEEIETTITRPIEAAVNTINGIDELRCSSNQGNGNCTITFVLERDIEAATQDVRDKVATVRFPRDTEPPVVSKIDPDAAPVLTLVVFSKRSPKEITQIADTQIKQVLETVQDVGEVSFFGDRRREIRVLLDPNRVNAYGLTVAQIGAAVDRQNTEIPGGSFIAGPSEFSMRTMGRLRDVREFQKIVLASQAGSVITLGDVARITDANEEVRSQTRLDGENAISMSIRKQSGSNTVTVVDRVMARLERIQTTLPSDIKVRATRDQSRFIRKSFEEIQHHLILGGLLAALVVLFFMRNWRVTVIAGLAIPISIIGTFSVMRALGFSLNNMTMLALSLATGIVIDDAIVVLENIFRYIEEKGATPREAAIKATQEIGLAVMATTLSLVVIFVPVAFMTGQVGRYFYSFGITSATAIMLSMFVSFTLTPALCAGWLRAEDAHKDHAKSTKQLGFYAWMDRKYGRMLEWSLHHRALMLGVAAITVASAAVLYPYVGKELVPDDDQSEFSVNLRLPRGTSFERTLEYMTPIEGELREALGTNLESMMTSIQNGSGNYSVQLTPLDQRQLSQQQLMQVARRTLSKYRNARISVSGGTDISGASTGGGGGRGRGGGGPGGGGGSNRLTMIVQGPDIDELQKYANTLLAKVKEIDGVNDADTSFEATQPELRIDIDRQRAADLGVSMDTLSSTMSTLVGGQEVSKFKDGDEQYSVRLRLDEPFRNDPAAMGNIFVPAAGRPDGPCQRRRPPDARQRAGVDRSLQPDAPDLGERQPRCAADHARERRRGGARQSRRAGIEGGLSGDVRRERAHAQPGGQRLRDCHHPRRRVHLHGARLAVQQLRPPADDHDGAAAQPAGRPAGAHGLRHDDQRLQRDRVDDALRHRQEELDPAGGLHQHAARGRVGPPHGDRPGQPRAAAADSDDDDCDRRRDAADRLRPRRGIGLARVDGRHDHRRADSVPPADAAHHAGRVFLFRRPESVAAERFGEPVPQAASSRGDRCAGEGRIVTG